MSLADQTLPSDGSVDRLLSTSSPHFRQLLKQLHFHLTLVAAPLKQQSSQLSVALFPPLLVPQQQQALVQR